MLASAGYAAEAEQDCGTGMRPQDRHLDLIADLAREAGASPPGEVTGFGRNACRFEKKIFVMLVRGRLALKLPADRVAGLVAAGKGDHFDANKGTPMKQWLNPVPESALGCLPLARAGLLQDGQRLRQ